MIIFILAAPPNYGLPAKTGSDEGGIRFCSLGTASMKKSHLFLSSWLLNKNI